MTRDELEAVIWRIATYRGDEGTSGYLLNTSQVDAILKAADAYMVAEGGLAKERRAVLEQAATRRKART